MLGRCEKYEVWADQVKQTIDVGDVVGMHLKFYSKAYPIVSFYINDIWQGYVILEKQPPATKIHPCVYLKDIESTVGHHPLLLSLLFIPLLGRRTLLYSLEA